MSARATACAAAGAAALQLLVAAPAARAQTIAERVARVADGTVHLSYATRSEVCGNGSTSIRYGRDQRTMHYGGGNAGSREWEPDPCEPGPARVSLTRRGGRVTKVRVYVGGRWRPGLDSVADLGTVGAAAAADYLLSVAERGEGRAGGEAIFAAVLADSVEVWPRLLRLARAEDRPRDARKQAVFWLGHAAGEAATAHLDTLAGDAAVDRDVREQAVFALSQRPRDEGVPALIRIARTNRDPAIRRKALFWLGQTGDPRAVDLFEELLTRRP